MKKFVLISSGIGGLLLLSVLVSTFVVQGSLTSANVVSGKQRGSAKTQEVTSSCMQNQQSLVQNPCTGNVGPIIKGKGQGVTATSTPIPTPQPTKPATPASTYPPTPIPTQVVPTPTPVSSNSGNGGGTTQEAQLTQNLFAQINSDRAAQGLPAYAWNGTLANGARQHSITMGQTACGLSHQCPGEPAPCQRVTNEGIHWMACGENAGYTSPYPNAWTAVKQNIEQGMLSEQPPNDGHRKNLLSSTFHQVGIGIFLDAKGVIWVTEDFTN